LEEEKMEGSHAAASTKVDSATGLLRPLAQGQFRMLPVPVHAVPEWNSAIAASPGVITVTPIKPHQARWTEEQISALCEALRTSPSQRDAAAALGLTYKAVVARIHVLREAGETRLPSPCRKPGKAMLPIPDDFAERASHTSNARLIARYGVCKGTIARWRRETGTVRRQVRPRPAAAPIEAREPRAASPRSGHARFKVDRVGNRGTSQAGEAAEFLRRFGPVYRADEHGNPKGRPTHWRRGSFVLTDQEIIERAERNGWRPDAWKALAA
jgi:hypothetical protein